MTTPEFDFSDTLDRLDDLDFVLKLSSYNTGKLEGYRSWVSQMPEANRVKWITHPSQSMSGVCEVCVDMRGTIFEIDDAEDMLPYHVNCLCSWRTVHEADEE